MTRERLAEISWANLSAPNEATGELITIDIALLAFDVYWRGGCNLLDDLWAKLRVNQARQWRADGTGPVEHVREEV